MAHPPTPSPAETRPWTVPWDRLAGLADALDAPLAEILGGAPAERVLDRFLRAHRTLDADGRRAVAEALFGVGLWRRRLRWRAGQTSAPRLLLAVLLRDLGGRDDAARLLGLDPLALPPDRAAPQLLADRWSLPDWLADELIATVGSLEGPALADALCLPAPVTLRANTALEGRGALAVRLLGEGIETRPGLLAPHALVVTSPRPNLVGSSAWREGRFELQDEGSQLLAAVVGARPGDAVLDLCAGAGGKALALSAEVGPAGAIHATDPDGDRLRRLRDRAARAGAGNVRVHGASPPAGLVADRVLVDAPCSELGTLRRGPDMRWRIDPSAFAALPALQLALCELAAARLRPGGRLVYATCTFRQAENEEVALGFEVRHPEFERLPPEAPTDCVTPEGFLRTWPHRHGCDGFFAAVWQHSPLPHRGRGPG
jgi:16S rRNA (cytosine967-C5)-methyltransferase